MSIYNETSRQSSDHSGRARIFPAVRGSFRQCSEFHSSERHFWSCECAKNLYLYSWSYFKTLNYRLLNNAIFFHFWFLSSAWDNCLLILPLWLTGVSYLSTDSDYVDSVYKKAVEIGVATWVGALQKLNGRVLQPDFTCNTSVPASQWIGGQELYT